MTKSPRDERVWLNPELEKDSAGYLAAQQARKQDEAAAEAKAKEDRRYRDFEEPFLAAGGSKADAPAAYRQRVNEQAAQAAATADEAAIRGQRGATMGRV